MNPQPQKVKSLSQTVTGGANSASVRDHLNYSLPAGRGAAFLRGALWPLTVIAVAALSSVLWTAVLLWLIGHAFW